MSNMPRPNNKTDNPAKSTDDIVGAELTDKLRRRVDAILQRKYCCV